MARILLLNGPNLNLLGSREPAVYGTATLQDIEKKLKDLSFAQGHELIAAQSNAEHELIGKIQATKRDSVGFVIINPGAFTHTSIALRDAFLSVGVPFIEIHLSNVFAARRFGITHICPTSRSAAFTDWARSATSSRSRPPSRA